MFDLFEEEDEMGRPKKKNDEIADDQPDMSTPASKKTKLTTEISGDFNNGVGNDISVNSRGRPRRSICLSKYQIVPMSEDIQVIEGDKEHQNPPRKKKVRKGRKVMGSMEETMNHLILLLEERKASEAMLSKTRNPSLANIKSEVRMSKYKTMYINCQKKIKNLEDENTRLRKKLKATTGKLEKYEKEKLGESEKVEEPCFGSTLTKAAQAILDLSSPPTTDDVSSPAVPTEPKSTDNLSTPAVRTEPKSLPSKVTKKAVAVKVSKKALRGSKKKTCMHCGTSKTPQWRAGPLGAGTLCNACGVRFRSGKLLPEYRPLASPSFDDKVHSNNHKKIMASPSLDDKVHSNNHKEIVETMIEQN